MRARRHVAPLLGVLLIAAPTAVVAADLETGKKTYAQKCASCHGPDGKGNAKMETVLKAKIPDLAAGASKADAEWQKIVAEGKKPMPGYGKALSKDEIESVVRYAKSLAGGK